MLLALLQTCLVIFGGLGHTNAKLSDSISQQYAKMQKSSPFKPQ
jgi:hypothetical protein